MGSGSTEASPSEESRIPRCVKAVQAQLTRMLVLLLAQVSALCYLCSVVQLQGLACRFCWELEGFSQDNCLRLPKGCGLKNFITIVRLSLYACGVGGNKCPALL